MRSCKILKTTIGVNYIEIKVEEKKHNFLWNTSRIKNYRRYDSGKIFEDNFLSIDHDTFVYYKKVFKAIGTSKNFLKKALINISQRKHMNEDLVISDEEYNSYLHAEKELIKSYIKKTSSEEEAKCIIHQFVAQIPI